MDGELTRQLFWFLLGLAGNFVMSAVYARYTVGQSRRAESIRKFEETWAQRLSSPDSEVRTRAFHDLLIRALRWFILGNVMFGISGFGWITDVFRAYDASNAVATLSSVAAVVMFGVALSWIKRYLRYTGLTPDNGMASVHARTADNNTNVAANSQQP